MAAETPTDLLSNPQIDLSRLSRADCATALAQCKALEGRLLARLLAAEPSSDEKGQSGARGGDRLLKVKEAAELLGVTESYLYHHAKRLNLGTKLGNGTLRFSRARLERFMRGERSKTSLIRKIG